MLANAARGGGGWTLLRSRYRPSVRASRLDTLASPPNWVADGRSTIRRPFPFLPRGFLQLRHHSASETSGLPRLSVWLAKRPNVQVWGRWVSIQARPRVLSALAGRGLPALIGEEFLEAFGAALGEAQGGVCVGVVDAGQRSQASICSAISSRRSTVSPNIVAARAIVKTAPGSATGRLPSSSRAATRAGETQCGPLASSSANPARNIGSDRRCVTWSAAGPEASKPLASRRLSGTASCRISRSAGGWPAIRPCCAGRHRHRSCRRSCRMRPR